MTTILNNTEEDIMDSLSVSDNFDMTREEENNLLEDNSMRVDSPNKSVANNETTNTRKAIVFDLGESTADEDNDNEDETRDKFKSERKTINFSSMRGTKREIPDTLEPLGRDLIKDYKRQNPGFLTKSQRKKRNRKWNRSQFGNRPQFSQQNRPQNRQQFSHQNNQMNRNSNPDLRQFINEVNYRSNGDNNHHSIGSIFLNQGLAMDPLLKYQMGLGIVNPNVLQNQLLVNALLAQSVANPLLNRLSMGGQNIAPNIIKTPKDDIQVVVNFDEKRFGKEGSVNSNITQTRSQIKCRVDRSMDLIDSNTDCEVIEIVPPLQSLPSQPKQKPQLSTLFSKHLANKVNQPKPQTMSTSKKPTFGEVLAEVEVGVDNDYLRRMEEQEKKRLEIKKFKEQRRQEMAGERLESALKLKKILENMNNY